MCDGDDARKRRDYRFDREVRDVVLSSSSGSNSTPSDSDQSSESPVDSPRGRGRKRQRIDEGDSSSQSSSISNDDASNRSSDIDGNRSAEDDPESDNPNEGAAYDISDEENPNENAADEIPDEAPLDAAQHGVIADNDNSDESDDDENEDNEDGGGDGDDDGGGSSHASSSDASSSSDEEDEEQDNGGPEHETLYEGARLSLAESLLAILTFAMTHSLTGACISDLLQLINLHCPLPNNCAKTLYKFKKFFSSVGRKTLKLHYFCEECYSSLISKDALCPQCNDSVRVSYFIEVPLIAQLQRMFVRPGFVDALRYRFERRKEAPENIEDVYDGSLYQSECQNNGFLSNPSNISFMWYSDGISIFKSSKLSLWPLCYVINELPYRMRTSKDNIILAGLWFGTSKPKVNLFLAPFQQSLHDLQTDGHVFQAPGHPNGVRVRAKLLCGTCDLQAKAVFLRAKASNGYYGCMKCKSRGQREPVNRTTVHVHRFNLNDMQPRTNEEVQLFSQLAVEHAGSCYGIKGPSLLYLMMVNMIAGTGIDVMHGVFIGVFKALMSLWFSESNSYQAFSLYPLIHVVDRRLQAIKPPNFVKRMPRSIFNHIKLWKAYEYKLFFFYYAAPVLNGMWANDRYFHHFMKLVSAIYLLSQRSIYPEQREHAGTLLREFVRDFGVLYGERNLGINVHQLLHLEQCVCELGPLWVYSCFFLEDLNGGLARLVHGTQYAGMQICSSATLYMSLNTMIEEMNPNSEAYRFCIMLRSKCSKRLTIAEDVSPTLKLIGKLKSTIIPDEFIRLIRDRFNVINGRFQCFTRISNYGKGVFSAEHPRTMKTLSVYALCVVNDVPLFCKILKFVRWSACICPGACLCVPANYFAIVQVCERVPWFIDDMDGVRVAYMSKVILTNSILCVNIVEELKCPCFYINVDESEYIASPVNLLEIE